MDADMLPHSQSAAALMEDAAAAEASAVAKIPIVVEVRLRPESTARVADVEHAVLRLLSSEALPYADGPLPLPAGEHPYLDEHVECLSICDCGTAAEHGSSVAFWQAALRVHVYQLCEDSAGEEADDDEEGASGGASYRDWALPARAFAGLWDSLLYDTDVKPKLLRYAATALLFSDKQVDSTLVSWNRVVLLHGPPGTGKTSLAKALAQKLSVRFAARYATSQLVEVNAHSLFSKWFSESGKLVGRLFAKIGELVDDPDALVFVLIDEVESLSAARRASAAEPSDAIRVVNALLTQLDALKAKPNVLVLTTSNITDAIDVAFVDRADIKAYVGPPGLNARYDILRSCVIELAAKGVVTAANVDAELPPPWAALPPPAVAAARAAAAAHAAGGGASSDAAGVMMAPSRGAPPGEALLGAAAAAEGLSGRALRKLPFLAHALGAADGTDTLGAGAYLHSLHCAVLAERADRAAMGAKAR